MSSFKTIFLSLFLCLTSLVHAEFLYTARDFGTLATDKSEARSLNESGWVAGKYFDKEQTSDFLWNPESGLQVISKEADKEVFPKLNNLGHVQGFNVKPGSWFSSAQMQKYVFKQQTGLKLGKWDSRDNGISIPALNDTYYILCNHVDVFKSTYSCFVGNGKLVEFAKDFKENIFPTAINNKSQILVTTESPGVFGSGVLAIHVLSLYDIATDQHNIIADDKLYYGCGLNDDGLVIARDKKGKEGFYGSKEKGMISLGNFIPSALNNSGFIVGKRGKEVLVRKPDGTMIDLNQAVDLRALGVDEIVDAWAINERGQVIVTVKISGKSHAMLLEPKN